MSKLSPKQELFCREFVVDCNGTQAAIRAGYARKSAKVAASRLLTNDNVASRIAELQKQVFDDVGVDARYVLRQAKELHERCMQDIYPVMVGTGKDRRQLEDDEGRPVFAFNAMGAAKGLEIIGKHIEVQAFSERHDHNHNHTGTIEHTKVHDSDKALIRELRKARGDGGRVTH